MGFTGGKLIGVICLYISINALVCLGRKKPDVDVFYQCFRRQTCTCNLTGRLKDCYDHMTGQSQRWFVEKFNACELLDVDYDNIIEGFEKICEIDEKEFKPCYEAAVSHYKKRYGEVVTGMHGQDESNAFEKARGCLESIVSYCESNPDGCMSVG